METQADQTQRILDRISARIEEDVAFARADFGEALALADASQSESLFVGFLAEQLDIFARYHLFLVPHMCAVDGFVDLVNSYAEAMVADVRRVPAGWRLKASARVSYWKGMALKRARTQAAGSAPAVPADSPRTLIGRWLKGQGLKHQAGASQLDFDPKVLSALKRGTALRERVCGPDTVRRVAEVIGCRPEQLDADYLTKTSGQ
jgi:hypothetical protein